MLIISLKISLKGLKKLISGIIQINKTFNILVSFFLELIISFKIDINGVIPIPFAI